jgi:hypothetical protein
VQGLSLSILARGSHTGGAQMPPSNFVALVYLTRGPESHPDEGEPEA